MNSKTGNGRRRLLFFLLAAAVVAAACVRPGPGTVLPVAEQPNAAGTTTGATEIPPSVPAPVASVDDVQSSQRTPETAETAAHVVRLGETLASIAAQYGLQADDLISHNQIEDINLILPGRVLSIPSASSAPATAVAATPLPSSIEIIPEAELVYGPTAADFDLAAAVANQDGYLANYEEEVEGYQLSGAEIVQLVADRHSVNPRLLLGILEFNAGWLADPEPAEIMYPLGRKSDGLEGLYKQLSWAANQLNWGFYGRSDGGLKTVLLEDDIPIPIAPDVSHGTAGVQNYLAARDDISYEQWRMDAGETGFMATYRALFGDTIPTAGGTLLPDSLTQPVFALPWESGETWFFSGGPHGGWNSGSAWAALDFVPPDVEGGCLRSDAWVTAVAAGEVTRSGYGAVVVDLDGDGYAGTGWAVTYMHLDDRNRIPAGETVETGDRLGHAACVGGVSNGTHLHIARTYNGRWISADGDLPFDFNGWISQGVGYEYNGWLIRGDDTKTADVLRSDDNAITAD